MFHSHAPQTGRLRGNDDAPATRQPGQLHPHHHKGANRCRLGPVWWRGNGLAATSLDLLSSRFLFFRVFGLQEHTEMNISLVVATFFVQGLRELPANGPRVGLQAESPSQEYEALVRDVQATEHP